jgi:glycosyltransferase involved in cell wall biosynthesis
MFRGRLVAVVIPAYNERDKIVATIRSVPGYVDHILVVDDGSSDGTAAAARRHAARRRGGVVEVLHHEVNRGVGAAIATGYARAVALGADATAVMAGDGQMDPVDLPRLLEPIVEGRADYAKGNRFAWPDGWRRMPPTRMLGNVVLSLATRVASGYSHVFDSQCGYTAASRRALLAIGPERMFARYGYPNDLLARLGAAGARVVDVPVRPVYGPAWRSGLRPARVAVPIALLLARACWRRLRVRRGPRPLEPLTDALVPLSDGT